MFLLRILTAVILLVVLFPVFYFDLYSVFLILVCAFFVVASWECFRLFGNKRPKKSAAFWSVAFVLLVYGMPFFDPTMLFGLASVIWFFCLAPLFVTGLPELYSDMSRSLNAVYGVTIFSAFIALIYLYLISGVYLLSIMALVWIADIGAYFSGKVFGRRKLAPSISPGKSWEGVIGGWICVMLFSLVCVKMHAHYPNQLLFPYMLHLHFGWMGLILIITVLFGLSIVGDLFESMLKRRIEFKDSSQLLPGHGGVLDRIDALIPVLSMAALIHYYFA